MSFRKFSIASALLLCAVHLAAFKISSSSTASEAGVDLSGRTPRVRRQFPCFGECKVPPSSEPLVKKMPTPIYGMSNGMLKNSKGGPDETVDGNDGELTSNELTYHGKFERMEMVNDFDSDRK